MNCFDFARAFMGKYKIKGQEIVPELCPVCHGGDHKDKESFALNYEKKTCNCKRGSCEAVSGWHFTELCKHFHVEADRDEVHTYQPKQYKTPKNLPQTAKERVESYLKSRGFSRETWERRGVGEYNGSIAFPYYEGSSVVLMKFRKPFQYTGEGMKSWREEDGKPVLWGMNLCDKESPIVIVEGEMDALALDECGIKNVLSVPSGSSDLNWIDLCSDFIARYNTIIFWGDNDAAGKSMVEKCVKKIGAKKCLVVNSPPDIKDANECLLKNGKIVTASYVEMAKPCDMDGIIDLADVQPIDIRKLPRVTSGIKSLDAKIGGFFMGDVSIWSGKSGQGKSTILGQILLDAIDNGHKVCAYSGELRADVFQYWIDLQAAGRTYVKQMKDSLRTDDSAYVPSDTLKLIHEWYRGKFFLYDNRSAQNNSHDGIMKVFEYAALRRQCTVFLVDNLMTAKVMKSANDDFYRAQSSFVGDMEHFAKFFNVHVHIVAHPKKADGEIRKEDISGSLDISNRAENVFVVSRGSEKDVAEGADSKIIIRKNRLYGVQDKDIGLKFDMVSKRFWPYKGEFESDKVYGWQKILTQHSVFDEMGEK
jgi:twinkle protein